MQLSVNGQITEVGNLTAFEVRQRLFPDCPVVILNGFQISQDHGLKEGDQLFLISKDTMPPKDQLEAMMAARHTPRVHEQLKKAKVAIAGLGGLGSNIAVSLARIGVGNLLLVDFDVVEPSNLNRQSYGIRHLGMHKTEALREQIGEINPFINIETQTVKVEKDNIIEIFNGWPIVCEAFDRPDSKALLVSTLLERMPETKIVAGSGMAGYSSSNQIKTEKKLKNLYVCGDQYNGAGIGNGLMAPRVLVCAGHQANMVLRLVMHIEQP